MIELKNITIKYNETLLEEAEIELKKGCITTLKGESGCGKSSLLYLIGLIKKDTQIVYTIDGECVKFSNEQECSDLRKQEIGYVFQDSSLLQHLNIYENLCWYGQMVGKHLSQSDALKLLKDVEIYNDLKQKIDTLSGGERQRIAIACALVKEPRLLILDEPTSALDKDNANQVIRVLRKCANQGVTIVIASHDQKVVNQSDIVYEFIHQKLVITKTDGSYKNDNKLFNNKKVSLTHHFYIQYLRKYFWAYKKTYGLLFTVLGFVISIFISFSTFSQLFINHQQELLNNIGHTEIMVTSISDEYGDIVFSSHAPMIDEIKIENIKQSKYCNQIFHFSQDSTTLISINGEVYNEACIVQPYTPLSGLNRKTDTVYDEEGAIYLSYPLAKKLEFRKGEISFECASSKSKIEGNIYGVINENVSNYYTKNENIIYVPIEHLPTTINTQALLVYCTDFQSVENLITDIRKIDSGFGVFNIASRVQSLERTFSVIQEMIPFLFVIIFIVSYAIVIMIYSRQIGNRKLEMCLLRVNGLSKRELIQLLILELLIQVLIISFIGMLLNILYTHVVDIASYMKAIGYASVFIFPISLASHIIFQKEELITQLRTNG